MPEAGASLFAKADGYYQSEREDMLRFVPACAKKVVEFGCGEGRFAAMVKERFGAEVWAVEIDERCAEIAASQLDKVICGDAMESVDRLPDGYFDCIICFDFLEHLVDPYTLLRLLKGKLAKGGEGGVIVSSIPNIRYYRTFTKFVIHGEWDYKDHGILDRTHLRFFTKKSIIKMWEQLGFRILLTKGIHPTSSRTCKLLQVLTFGLFSDVRYKHFVSIVKAGANGAV